jgi:hypothetical protein
LLRKGNLITIFSCRNVLSFRPTIKHPEIDGCYFVGASTHPGTGVPVCLAGAKLTATEIMVDAGIIDQPRAAPYKKGRPSVGLDTISRPKSGFQAVLAAMAFVFTYLLYSGPVFKAFSQ